MKIASAEVAKKEFRWSYSKIKNMATCPKRHYEIDLAKNYEDGDSDGRTTLKDGNDVHDALAKALTAGARLPNLPSIGGLDTADLQRWADKVAATPGALLAEQKIAITRDFKPCTFFSKQAWFSGIIDVMNLVDDEVIYVRDWKTGKVLEDPVQLMLFAVCIFVHYPKAKRVITEYVWLKEDTKTVEVFDRAEVAREFSKFLPQVDAYEKACKDQNFPPKPNGLCKKFCKVTSCVFHGKGARG